MYCLVMVACGNMKLFRTTFEKKIFYLVMLILGHKFAAVFMSSLNK